MQTHDLIYETNLGNRACLCDLMFSFNNCSSFILSWNQEKKMPLLVSSILWKFGLLWAVVNDAIEQKTREWNWNALFSHFLRFGYGFGFSACGCVYFATLVFGICHWHCGSVCVCVCMLDTIKSSWPYKTIDPFCHTAIPFVLSCAHKLWLDSI